VRQTQDQHPYRFWKSLVGCHGPARGKLLHRSVKGGQQRISFWHGRQLCYNLAARHGADRPGWCASEDQPFAGVGWRLQLIIQRVNAALAVGQNKDALAIDIRSIRQQVDGSGQLCGMFLHTNAAREALCVLLSVRP
jgi:hypothetical protein